MEVDLRVEVEGSNLARGGFAESSEGLFSGLELEVLQ